MVRLLIRAHPPLGQNRKSIECTGRNRPPHSERSRKMPYSAFLLESRDQKIDQNSTWPRTTYLLSFPKHPFTLARHAYFETSIASLLSHNAEGFYPPERNHGRPATWRNEGTTADAKDARMHRRMEGRVGRWKKGKKQARTEGWIERTTREQAQADYFLAYPPAVDRETTPWLRHKLTTDTVYEPYTRYRWRHPTLLACLKKQGIGIPT